jgi:hypothetical protein
MITDIPEPLEPTKCNGKDPNTCRNHGGRKIDDKSFPAPWLTDDQRMDRKVTSEARQIHGFKNEYRVCQKLDLEKTVPYTSEWDARTKTPSASPFSIKTKEIGKAVEMGDFFRNSLKSEDFYLHVSFWKNDKYNIVSEHLLYIPYNEWQKFFPKEYDNDIRTMLRNSSPDHSYDAKWKLDILDIQEKWKSTGSIIKLCPKRDHKGQIRMQCAIGFKDFIVLEKLYGVESVKN